MNCLVHAQTVNSFIIYYINLISLFLVHFRCFLDRNTFQWLRSLNSSGKYLYQSCYRKELCLIDGMRLVYAAIKVYQRLFFDCLSQNLNMLFFCLHQLFFVIQFFFQINTGYNCCILYLC